MIARWKERTDGRMDDCLYSKTCRRASSSIPPSLCPRASRKSPSLLPPSLSFSFSRRPRQRVNQLSSPSQDPLAPSLTSSSFGLFFFFPSWYSPPSPPLPSALLAWEKRLQTVNFRFLAASTAQHSWLHTASLPRAQSPSCFDSEKTGGGGEGRRSGR